MVTRDDIYWAEDRVIQLRRQLQEAEDRVRSLKRQKERDDEEEELDKAA